MNCIEQCFGPICCVIDKCGREIALYRVDITQDVCALLPEETTSLIGVIKGIVETKIKDKCPELRIHTCAGVMVGDKLEFDGRFWDVYAIKPIAVGGVIYAR